MNARRVACTLAVAAALVGCTDVARFTAGPTSHVEAGVDGTSDATPVADTGCTLGTWSQPSLLSAPSELLSDDWNPFLSRDGKSLYFMSWRDGGYGDGDLWVATRTTAASDFGAAVNLGPGVNSSCIEGEPAVSGDGRTLFYSSRLQTDGTCGVADIWMATRNSTGEPFGNAQPVTELNSPATEWSPSPTADLRTIYFTSSRDGDLDVFVATRAAVDSPFGTPIAVGELNSPEQERNVLTSADGLTLIITSRRSGGPGGVDMWIAQRLPDDRIFSIALFDVPQTAADDVGGALTGDGRHFYYNYNSDVSGVTRRANIYRSTRRCLLAGDPSLPRDGGP